MPKPRANSITFRGEAANDFVNAMMAAQKPHPKIDPCEYVRTTYRVPARVGMHVTYEKAPGIIKGGSNYVSVLLAGHKSPVNIHPTDQGLIYLNDDGSQAWPA